MTFIHKKINSYFTFDAIKLPIFYLSVPPSKERWQKKSSRAWSWREFDNRKQLQIQIKLTNQKTEIMKSYFRTFSFAKETEVDLQMRIVPAKLK